MLWVWASFFVTLFAKRPSGRLKNNEFNSRLGALVHNYYLFKQSFLPHDC